MRGARGLADRNARRYGVGVAIATVAAVAAAGVAAYAFIDLRVSDVYVLAGIAIALIAVTAAWPVSGPSSPPGSLPLPRVVSGSSC
jgi:hypothetical protein